MSVFFSFENLFILSKLWNWEMSVDKDGISNQEEQGERNSETTGEFIALS